MEVEEPALTLDSEKRRVPFDRLAHARDGAHDKRVEALPEVAFPARHGRDVGLYGGVAVGLRATGFFATFADFLDVLLVIFSLQLMQSIILILECHVRNRQYAISEHFWPSTRSWNNPSSTTHWILCGDTNASSRISEHRQLWMCRDIRTEFPDIELGPGLCRRNGRNELAIQLLLKRYSVI